MGSWARAGAAGARGDESKMEILPRSVCAVRRKLAWRTVMPFQLPLCRNLRLVFGFGFEGNQSVMATILEDSDA